MVTGKEVERQLGVPYVTLWRRAKDGTVPVHMVKRNPWDKKPQMLFRVSEVAAALGIDRPAD